MVNHVHYFAYGSNMNPQRMKEREAHYFKREKGILSGYRVVFNKRSSSMPGYAAANIIKDDDGVVEGFVYTTIPEIVGRLDMFENAPFQYTRELVSVMREDGSTVLCVTYIAHPEWVDKNLSPRTDYLAHLLAAQDELSAGYIEQLKQSAEGKY